MVLCVCDELNVLTLARFSSPESDLQPTMGLIDEIFGPSFPGDYEKDNHQYNVHYPGLTFCFPIPPEYDSIYANPHGS